MTEEAVSLAETEVNDEQVEKFFNGEDAGLPEAEVSETTESAPEPEKREPEPEQEKQEPEKEKYVPHGALHEERMRRKELQAQLEETRERTRKMEETFQKIQERIAQEQAVKYEDDPIEYIRQENEQLKQRLQHYDQRFNQQDEQTQAYQQHQEMVTKYQAAAAEFSQATPEFNDAYKYLISSRLTELQAIGYDPSSAQQMLTQEEAMVVQKAMQDGVNPAERVYALAKARGFTKQESKEIAQEAEKMATLQKGVEASKTLGSGGGKGELTLETLADLEGEEFDKAWLKMVGGE